MTQIICLANSKKYGNRCIAGIETTTGNWIRPVSDLKDGSISRDRCLVDGEELKLLDILQIPLATSVYGYEGENRLILPGKWQRVGKASIIDLLPYCEPEIIHSQFPKAVPYSFLQSLPLHQRRTLQLIRTTELNAKQSQYSGKWEACLKTANGQYLTAKITDLSQISRLNKEIAIRDECLITISLAQPWRKNNADELSCWKLIAGVIELSQADLILVEMRRLGWTIEQGRNYLQQTYGKQSRKQLTDAELVQFLRYLKSVA